MRAGGLFRPIHHNRASCAERTGFPFGVEHGVVVRRGAHDARVTQPPLRLQPIRGSSQWGGSDRPGLRDERKGWIMSVKLTDAQLVMMSAAAQREDHCLAAPETMKGAVVSKAGTKLVKLGFAREIHAKSGTPLWRRDETGRSFALKLTAAGLKAIAVDEGPQDEPGEASQCRAALKRETPNSMFSMALFCT